MSLFWEKKLVKDDFWFLGLRNSSSSSTSRNSSSRVFFLFWSFFKIFNVFTYGENMRLTTERSTDTSKSPKTCEKNWKQKTGWKKVRAHFVKGGRPLSKNDSTNRRQMSLVLFFVVTLLFLKKPWWMCR